LAVQTTVGELQDALFFDESISVGRVKYIDYSQSYASVNGAFFSKRRAFEYEREVRAVLRHSAKNALTGICRPIDPNAMIQAIYVSPVTPLWFEELVAKMAKALGYSGKVFRSQLDELPFH
jgi:hypothetical protein